MKFRLYWHDSRIIFRNLHPDKNDNTLNNVEIEKIWTPKLFIMNSNNMFLEAEQTSEGTFGTVEVHRDGSPYLNELLEIDEDYLYPGIENKIQLANYFVIKLSCKFDLKWWVFQDIYL